MNNSICEFERWFNDGGDEKYRYTYDLNKDSVVFDLGGFEGNWSNTINNLYKPTLYIFEPIKKYYNNIVSRFKNETNIKVYNFGLSDKKQIAKINLSNDASSIHISETLNFENIELEDISDFLNENELTEVDLLKINIEGCEYELLERLINANKLTTFKNIQVQFHIFVDNAIERRNKIREFLQKTHTETYCYNFVWENWKLKNV